MRPRVTTYPAFGTPHSVTANVVRRFTASHLVNPAEVLSDCIKASVPPEGARRRRVVRQVCSVAMSMTADTKPGRATMAPTARTILPATAVA